MTHPADRYLSELRSLLQQAPSPSGWELICRALDDAYREDPTQFRDKIYHYVDSNLSQWPDELRVAPPRWYTRDELPSALLSLARALYIDHLIIDNHRDNLLKDPALDFITRIEIPRTLYTTPPLHGALLPALTHAAPRLTHLQAHLLLGAPVQMAPLAHMACAPHLRHMGLLGAPLGQPDSMDALVRADLPRLTSLSLEGCQLRRESISALADASWLPQLTALTILTDTIGQWVWELPRKIDRLHTLRLGNTQLNERALARALSAHACAELEELDISSNSLDHAGLRTLPTAACLPTLKRLDLSSLHLRPAIRDLVASPLTLDAITLRNNNISDACDAPVAELLTRIPHISFGAPRTAIPLVHIPAALLHEDARELFIHQLALTPALHQLTGQTRDQLTSLSLPMCDLADAGLLALCHLDLPALTTLRLHHNSLRDLTPLAHLPAPRLTTLDLSSNPCGGQALSALPPTLTSLALRGCSLTALDAAALAASPPPALRHLDLSSNTQLRSAGARALLRSAWPALLSLDLTSCSVELDALEAIIDAPNMPRLHTIRAAYNAFTPTHKALPALHARAAQRGLSLILAR